MTMRTDLTSLTIHQYNVHDSYPPVSYVLVEGYWLRSGEEVPHSAPGYIMTPTVRENLRDLARAVSSAEYPVLLQGPTSAGKSTLTTSR